MALWLGTLVQRRRPSAPGAPTFMWLMVAVGGWCLTSAFHTIATTLASKLLLAKVQYLFVASVPVFWLLFTAEYAGVAWGSSTRLRRGLWVVPAVTVVMAATNEWHRALWPAISIEPNGGTIYTHGWWFWVAASFNYAVMGTGTVLLARALRRSPPAFQSQLLMFIVAALIPWAGNLVYLLGLATPGFDVTPPAFAVSGLIFGWAIYRNHLFDLIPVARDMVVDSLSDAVIVLDPSRRVLDANAAATELLAQGSNVIGRCIDTVLPALADTPLSLSGESVAVEVTRRDGVVPYDVRVMPVRTATRDSAAWVVLMRDVSDQRRAAVERDALEKRVQEQQRRESLSVLAGGLAHDFNNLLAGIVGYADLLSLQVPPKSEMRSNLSAILLGAQRAADLVSKMLAYAGERHGSVARVDLDALTEELLDLLRASAARHCTVTYRGATAVIDADPTQIRQLVMNLIINAAESVEEGTGVVTITSGSGRLTARQLAEMTFGQDAEPGDYAYLEVSDTGTGMDQETQRRIFTPFFTTKSSGHGLGLAAVQGIVHGHHGALRLDSQPGAGSRFSVWFPLATDAERTVAVPVNNLVERAS
jgi:signal transduction histidine kinase